MLPDIIPQVTGSMTETKKEVSAAALEAMTASCDVIGNRDIEHMTQNIIRSITNPEEVSEIMHTLAGVTFVQSVQAPALAFVVPLLIRGLRSKMTATRRQSAVIIDNMSKLVDDPLDAKPFLPTLMPALAFAADAMSDPEARKVAENASSQLSKLSHTCEHLSQLSKEEMHARVLQSLTTKVVVSPELDIAYNYVASLCLSLMRLRKFEMSDWDEVARYLHATCNVTYADSIVKDLIPECKELAKVTEIGVEDEDDDGAEDLCNCQFTLAYGTKILLHNTTMRLKKGHKYGLLGGNDSGQFNSAIAVTLIYTNAY
jgi:elongation factor 3